MKITGVYYVAAALLFFGYREQVEAGRQPDNAYTYSVGFVVFKALGLMLFTAVLFLLVRQRFAVSQFVEFVLPGAVISGYMMWNEIENGRGEFKMRFYRLLGFIAPFGLGFIGPILLFLFFYIWSGCFEDLYRGLVLIPQRQVSNVAWPMQKPLTMAAALPYAGLLCSSLFRAEHRERSFIPLLALLFVCLPLTPILKVFYPFVWRSAIWLLPFVVPIGCLLLVKLRRSERVSDQKRLSVFLMISMAAMISLVQYPFAAPIYFCYAAPLIAVAVLFIVTAQPTIAKGSHLAVLMFYLVFAICLMNPGYVYNLGFYYRQNEPQYTLELERGGIRVHEIYRGVYEKLVREIRLRAAKGSFIYAAPDCPEVYFLSGMQNPTRTMFDHLDDPVPNRADRILKVLEEKRVRVVVINLWPQFSRSLDAGLYRSLGTRFPHGMGIDWFVILWRDSD